MTKSIEILIAKYFSDRLTNVEMKQLVDWVESGKNKKVFNDYIALNFTIEELKSVNKDDSILWKYIESGIRTPVRKIRYRKYIAAASILLIAAITVLINKKEGVEFINVDTPVVVNNNIEVGSVRAVLTTEKGEAIVLEKGKTYSAENVSSDGEKIIYNRVNLHTKREIAYNYMSVPRGGQFYLELSDNTKVWLNSDSKIKYPKTFIKNQDRKVELIYGEAYFEVSPSVDNNGAKFKVISDGQEIEVLGTEFNVKSYKEDKHIFTTLVEGKVQILNNQGGAQLNPNQQSVVNKETNIINVRSVNTYDQISWKDGVFSFRGMRLKKIMETLERWYDVEVIFEDVELEDIKFIGVFRKNQNIEKILTQIKITNHINTYDIKDKQIVLK